MSSPVTGIRQLFATRLSAQRQAVPDLETTAQGLPARHFGGCVLAGRGADIIIIDDPLKPEEPLSQAPTTGSTTPSTAD
jgi:hypothetical protein